jgi:cytochrome c
MTLVILCGAALAVAVLWLLWKEVRSPDETIGRRFWPVVAVLSVVVLFMGTGRHMIRETAVDPHRQLVEARTEEYMARVRAAQTFALIPGGLEGEALPPGAMLFRRACSSCHAKEGRLVGPPLAEIAPLYAGDPEGIVAWAKKPGRKRLEYPAMPAQNLPDEDLRAIAEFILESGE